MTQLTSDEVAARFGVDRSTVSRWARKPNNRLASKFFGHQRVFLASVVRKYKPTPSGNPLNRK